MNAPGFLSPLRLELMTDPHGMPLKTRDDRQLYRLLSAFLCMSDAAGLIEVPEGYVTDLCSQPQITMSLFGETAQEPSVPHDYAYSTHCVDRATADRMLYELCVLTGIPKWKAALIYAGVRVGGGSHWSPTSAPSDTRLQARPRPS